MSSEGPRRSLGDVEKGSEARPIAHGQYLDDVERASHEDQALLSSADSTAYDQTQDISKAKPYGCCHKSDGVVSRVNVSRVLLWVGAFVGGVVATLVVQAVFPARPPVVGYSRIVSQNQAGNAAASSVRHFPPIKPSNWDPEKFPTNIGFEGPTPTGVEPGLVATAPAYPVHTGAPNLLGPTTIKGSKGKEGFDIFKHWGNLSPWYSVPSANFGLPETSPEAPEGCKITGLHFVHRHGARYPTSWSPYGGPGQLADKIKKAKKSSKFKAKGQLKFLNDWNFQLGSELLVPFGRQQMYDLGVNLRIKYGFLLQNFTQTVPVFRTESQHRMLHSALNFAIGFFGYPFEGQYEQSITYETPGVNNTLAPYMTCDNAGHFDKGFRALWYVKKWNEIYLKTAQKRLSASLDGIDISIEDTYAFQSMCAYETVALGYSKFCELFTEEEWKGFGYSLDLSFWYNSAFGSPVARVQGIGYIQELVARLTHTPIPVHNSSTNSTLDDNPITFPLDHSLYVDATHEVVVLNIITALNLSNFAETGPLPYDHIPPNRSFKSSELSPFGTNIQFQLLSCDSIPGGPQIRVIINDGVTPLTGIKGCPKNEHGMCPVDTFVAAMKENIAKTDWNWDCHGDWDVEPGDKWTTTTGDPPSKEEGKRN
ncbi:hypothetical protein FRC02_008933 [Tulasnella sp. 418]|nr:hypothetical protein FRC02_008933 [Tulasnella sp. 418]